MVSGTASGAAESLAAPLPAAVQQQIYGKGFTLLAKAGYLPGTGLGRHNHGISTPVMCTSKRDHRGLATAEEVAASQASARAAAAAAAATASGGADASSARVGATGVGSTGRKASEKRRLARIREEKRLGLSTGALIAAQDQQALLTAAVQGKPVSLPPSLATQVRVTSAPPPVHTGYPGLAGPAGPAGYPGHAGHAMPAGHALHAGPRFPVFPMGPGAMPRPGAPGFGPFIGRVFAAAHAQGQRLPDDQFRALFGLPRR